MTRKNEGALSPLSKSRRLGKGKGTGRVRTQLLMWVNISRALFFTPTPSWGALKRANSRGRSMASKGPKLSSLVPNNLINTASKSDNVGSMFFISCAGVCVLWYLELFHFSSLSHS